MALGAALIKQRGGGRRSPTETLNKRAPWESLFSTKRRDESVCHALLRDPKFFMLLTRMDHDLAEQVRAGRCRCGGALHRADYPRKPRGCPAPVRAECTSRLSFCCAVCRARATSRSVRFLGRRVYLGLAVVLQSARPGGPTATPQPTPDKPAGPGSAPTSTSREHGTPRSKSSGVTCTRPEPAPGNPVACADSQLGAARHRIDIGRRELARPGHGPCASTT